MKNQCTGRILCSAFAMGASLLFANTVLSDKGEVKAQVPSKGQSTSARAGATVPGLSRTGATKQTRTVKSATTSAMKPGAAPSGGIAGGCTTCPGGAIVEVEPNCGIPTDNTNGGCNSNPNVFGTIACGQTVCGTGAFDGSTRDTDWYKLVLAQDSQVDWTGIADFPLLIGIVNNFGIDSCTGVSAFKAFAVGGACTQLTASTCLTAGTWYLFIAPDFVGTTPCGSQYVASVSCTPSTCVSVCGDPNNHPCNQQGGPGCSDADCCNIVCAADPFCCSVSWDGICVGEAASMCGGGSNCCFASGGLGCDDPTCTAAICAADPFCCSVQWDGICANEAANSPDCPCGFVPPEPCDPANANETCDVATDGGVLGPAQSVTFNGTAVCAEPDCAIFAGAGQGNLWVKFETTGSDSVKVQYCGSAGVWGNAWLGIAEGCPCASFIGGASFAFSCPDGNVEILFPSVPAGVHYYPIMIDPANGSTGSYSVTITAGGCPPDTCPWDNAGPGGLPNGVVNIDDLLGVINHWGACP